ncbi:TetR/AcrR family transcriptional regulator [Nocardiopsis dassonvillei]|uniref:TetR/AcrR family transcriptional regulator n=1 Tax=Nocardiopsis dassonvillei TaxID=2014 RepID=UPI0020108077|nr:TetR/AcrR family transcriptional regulator [Nocardiopsis dassonvillei]MCK9870565.1 TetR/AcrR family transcriptional regulator [Nocardiopsis dassonvillei]
MPTQPARGPGRPREEAAGRVLLDATVELLLEHEDPGRVTVAAITDRAGVARATLYRRWDSREELIAEALDSVREMPRIADTGDLLADLEPWFGPEAVDDDPRTHRLIRTRLIQALSNPELRRVYWERYIRPRREPLMARLRAEAHRGGLPADTDVETLAELIAGVAYYQMFVRPDDGRYLDRMRRAVRLLLGVHGGGRAPDEGAS